jgi:ketosteroid isomerase-like protein
MNDPRALFTRLIDEAFNTGNLDVLDELVSPDLVEHQFESPTRPAPVVGPAGVARIITELRRGSHDFHLAVEDASVTGDTVFARLRATGTDTGGQLGNPPTGRTFEITVIDVARYGQDGQMVEHWGVPDRLGLLQQLGLLAAPAKPAEATAAPGSGHVQVDRPYVPAGGGRQ